MSEESEVPVATRGEREAGTEDGEDEVNEWPGEEG